MNDPRELHETRLTTTDEQGNRVYVYPEDIKGKWNNRRKIVYWVLMILFMVLPWIHFQGRQMIQLNVPEREFIFFGSIFYAHDAPMVFMLLVSFILTIGFVTSIFGRVWCGWTCPQSVFINSVFLKLEQLVEGNARVRKSLDSGPWTLEKIIKKTIKWALFTIVSLHISHSFLGWFVGSRELLEITLQHSPVENRTLFITMLVMTGIILFDFGWFREQFCLIACPYGRIQSVMMDEHSLVVAYDKKRGEPRRGHTEANQNEGDCINCFHCVKACPTGIDIRRGTQLECIACTNCIDACDEIMHKVGKPEGLIRYDSEANIRGEKRLILRPRNIIYAIIVIIALSVFAYVVNEKQGLHAHVLRAPTPFIQTQEKNNVIVINQFKLFLEHHGQALVVNGQISGINKDKIQIVPPLKNISVSGRAHTQIVVFKFSKDILTNGTKKEVLEFTDKDGNIIATTEVPLVGPK